MIVDDGKLKQVIEYVNSSPDYSFERFIKEHNLEKDSVQRAFDVVIKCPFHVDYSPSCSMNDTLHVFNCFSCGRSGSYVKFRALYSTEVEGIRSDYYHVANKLLRSDAAMQAALGFNTIFKNMAIPSNSRKRNRFSVTKGEVAPASFLELSSLLMASGANEEMITLFILLMQQGFSVTDVYNELFGKKAVRHDSGNVTVYDLENLFNG